MDDFGEHQALLSTEVNSDNTARYRLPNIDEDSNSEDSCQSDEWWSDSSSCSSCDSDVWLVGLPKIIFLLILQFSLFNTQFIISFIIL